MCVHTVVLFLVVVAFATSRVRTHNDICHHVDASARCSKEQTMMFPGIWSESETMKLYTVIMFNVLARHAALTPHTHPHQGCQSRCRRHFPSVIIGEVAAFSSMGRATHYLSMSAAAE